MQPLSRAFRFLRTLVRPNVTIVTPDVDARIDWNVPIAVRDGTILRANVFRPDTTARVPVILSAHPYGKDKIPAKTRSGRGTSVQFRLIPQPDPIRISPWTSWEAPDPAFWVKHGYAVVNADLRGGGTSGGTADLFSDEEARDYYDLIEWAGTQPWSSGRVGLDGVSYLAIAQYKAAALRPPHLAAMCPWEGFTDLYRDFARPGGVREDGFSILWSAVTGKEARVREALRDGIVAHESRDAWYRARTPELERIEVPLLVCGSFSDHSLHTRGAFEAFRRAGSARKRLYTHREGKWSAYYGDEASRTRLRFFDAELKGIENGWATEPPVRLAIADTGSSPAAVTFESAWPPTDVVPRTLRLDASAATLRETDVLDVAAATIVRTRGAHAAFAWTIDRDVDVIGPMALRVFIETDDVRDVSVFAGIRKYRDGTECTFEGSYGFSGDMVSKGWQRAAHRELDPLLSTPLQPVHTHERAEPLVPGVARLVEIALRPHATRFRAGDVLRLEIRGRWPYGRDPFFGQFPAGYRASRAAAFTIRTGGAHDSCLLLATRPVRASSA